MVARHSLCEVILMLIFNEMYEVSEPTSVLTQVRHLTFTHGTLTPSNVAAQLIFTINTSLI